MVNTAESLRSLVINSLVQTLIDPNTKASDRTNCARVLGQVTEVAAFTTRNETTVIKDSSELRLQILDELRSIMLSSNQTITDIDTDSLLAELVPEAAIEGGTVPQSPLFDEETVPGSLHIIPDKQSISPEISTIPAQSDSDRIQKRAPYEK